MLQGHSYSEYYVSLGKNGARLNALAQFRGTKNIMVELGKKNLNKKIYKKKFKSQ